MGPKRQIQEPIKSMYLDLAHYIPTRELQKRGLDASSVFVQGAWRRVVEELPEGYMPIPYQKFQSHPDGRTCIVETEAEHRDLYESDPQWELPPVSDLLARFLQELS